MRRLTTAVLALAGMLTLAIVAACGTQESTLQTAGAPAPGGSAEITFKSDPEVPKVGDNTFEVMVMQDGKAVDDAQVSVEFHMAAMPQMKMAEMRTKADLKPAGNGMYRGAGQVMMAGNWDVTVMAMRNGQEIGSRRLTLAAR